jgi:hypothetical protein
MYIFSSPSPSPLIVHRASFILLRLFPPSPPVGGFGGQAYARMVGLASEALAKEGVHYSKTPCSARATPYYVKTSQGRPVALPFSMIHFLIASPSYLLTLLPSYLSRLTSHVLRLTPALRSSDTSERRRVLYIFRFQFNPFVLNIHASLKLGGKL